MSGVDALKHLSGGRQEGSAERKNFLFLQGHSDEILFGLNFNVSSDPVSYDFVDNDQSRPTLKDRAGILGSNRPFQRVADGLHFFLPKGGQNDLPGILDDFTLSQRPDGKFSEVREKFCIVEGTGDREVDNLGPRREEFTLFFKRDFSGVVFVISLLSDTVINCRPGDVGLKLFIGLKILTKYPKFFNKDTYRVFRAFGFSQAKFYGW